MEINEEKQYGLHKTERQIKQIKKIYSDHIVILISIDFIGPKEKSRKEKVIPRKGYKKYQTIIQEKEVSKILEKGKFQESYNTWVDEAENAMKQVEKIKTKNSRKDTWKI